MRSTREKVREILLLFVPVFVVGVIGALARHQRDVPVSPAHYQAWGLVLNLGTAVLVALAVVVVCRIMEPPASWAVAYRVSVALFFLLVGSDAGCRYVHLCFAGSRLVEGAAVFGTPVVAATLAAAVWPRWLAFVLAASVVAAVWLLAQPYLALVHGE